MNPDVINNLTISLIFAWAPPAAQLSKKAVDEHKQNLIRFISQLSNKFLQLIR